MNPFRSRGRTPSPRIVVVTAVVCLLALSVAAVAVARRSPQARHPVGATARVPLTTGAGLTARVELSQATVRSGGLVRGAIVLRNPRSVSRVLLHGCAVNGLFAVGFRMANGYIAHPAFTLVGCDQNLPRNEIVAKPGITILRFHAQALYGGCSGGAQTSTPYSPDWLPPCVKGSGRVADVIPGLPAGTESVVFVPDGDWSGPRVVPARLTITAP